MYKTTTNLFGRTIYPTQNYYGTNKGPLTNIFGASISTATNILGAPVSTTNFYGTNTVSENGGSGSTPFVKEGLILIDKYNTSEDNFTGEFNGPYLALKQLYPNYKQKEDSLVITSLTDIIYSLLLVKNDLKTQINNLENANNDNYKFPKLKLNNEYEIKQNTSLKLVYLQYLLLYDLSLTDGIFIDAYLDEAKKVLEQNGGSLFHPNKQ